MKRMLATILVASGLVLTAPTLAFACPRGDYGSSTTGGGTNIGGACPGDGGDGTSDPGSGDGPYVPSGPPPPVYEDYYTPACSPNGPPGSDAGVMCMGAATVCDYQTPDDPSVIWMQHWRRQVPGGTWDFVGNECRGANDPTTVQPEVTEEMVLDEAYAAAPKPSAAVQPGTRSYVNVPNNYYANAPGRTTTVNVLGIPIQVVFTVNQISWDFGDGTSATGAGVQNAAVGAAGAVEHAYVTQGSYTIRANSTVGVRFTLPDGSAVDLPNAFEFSSAPVVLPVGEIQTRVDSTS